MAKETAYSVLEQFGTDIVSALGKSLPREKDTTGALRESIHFQIKILGQKMQFKLMLEDYYKWVDEGRRKGKGIPVNVLKSWLTYPGTLNKLRANDAGVFGKSKNKSKKSLLAVDRNRINSLSYVINKKIREEGIKPTHFYSKVVTPNVFKELKKDLTEVVKKEIIIEIKK